jgi:predicted Fe-Mo cluster-binding NifX family protein
MKIAVTSQGNKPESQVDPRFGRAKWFVIFDTDTDSYEALDNTQVLNLPQGAGIQAAQHIIDSGAEVLLTGHCGPNAFNTLSAGNVKVVTGVGGTVGEAIDKHQKGEMKTAGAPDVEGHW